jgi:hypothetical protein
MWNVRNNGVLQPCSQACKKSDGKQGKFGLVGTITKGQKEKEKRRKKKGKKTV